MKIADLFCGCGGLSLGFEQAGFDVAWACDNWDLALETYSNNFDHPAEKIDISDVELVVEKIKQHKCDVIVGGPPCQDFSSAGHRKEGTRADLTFAYAKIIETHKPRLFVMENVARTRNSSVYKNARKLFKKAGYGLTEVVLDASKCGVPQLRKRFFCIGFLDEEDGFLDEIINKNLSTKRMTVRDYLGNSIDVEHYYRHPRNYNRRGVFSVDEPAATIRGVNRPIPEGYTGHHNDTAKLGKNVRPLTTLERALIQTFPETYKWLGSKTAMEQMIGNAVPVNLGKFIGTCIQEFLAQNKIILSEAA